MNWFRMFNEARNDTKLLSLTSDQFRVWFRLLCYASEQERRGTIAGRSLKVLALEVAGGDQNLLVATCEALVELDMIEFDVTGAPIAKVVFRSFEKRQFFNRSDDRDEARKRAAKSRAKKRKEPVTASHAESRRVTPNHGPRTEQSRVEVEETPIPPLAIVRPEDPVPESDPEPDPELEPFHPPPVVVSPDALPTRTGQDLADWNDAIIQLRRARETEPLAGSMEMYAEDGRVTALEGWRFLHAARVVGQPGAVTDWRYFLTIARNATKAQFEAWGRRGAHGEPARRPEPEPRRLPIAPASSPMWALSEQCDVRLDKHAQ